ncbi:MAG: hypothetical protein CSA49_03570 [Gammaproteobacteria bacterium]|nr:MAG: hypothetical protein CSA49_03570 [Gammaproteobacteria bacterium]
MFNFARPTAFLLLGCVAVSNAFANQSGSLTPRVEALENLKISGSFRLNYSVKDFDDGQKERGGDATFNMMTLGVDTQAQGIKFSAQYRWYGFVDTVHHMYVERDLDNNSSIQAGLIKVPFGILPYESNNFWFGIPYYLGFNDDYDMGLSYSHSSDKWDIQVAYFFSSEYSAGNHKRYSFDVVNASNSKNEESNQLNIRSVYKFANSEFGFSGQFGQLYNADTEKNGDQWAVAIHHKANFGRFNTQFEAISYEFNPENPAGTSDDSIFVGAFADAYQIASKGNIYVFNVSYDVPINSEIVNSLKIYNDYSMLEKDGSGFNDSVLNTLGAGISIGSIWINMDFFMAKNVLYIGGGRDGFAEGQSSNEWNTFFNINAGYYF